MRDVFSMGAKPIASMNSLRFGHLDNDHTKMLFTEVVRGIASYGNVIDVQRLVAKSNLMSNMQKIH